jgi:hypothetical protein
MKGLLGFVSWKGARKCHHPENRQEQFQGESHIRKRRKTVGKTSRMGRLRGFRISKLRFAMFSPLNLWKRVRFTYIRLTGKLLPSASNCDSKLSSSYRALTEEDLIWSEYLTRDKGLSAMSRFTME